MTQKTIAKLAVLSEDERTRLLAESREKLQRDIFARERAAEEKGIEKGIEQGRIEERLAFARKLLEDSRTIDEIMRYTSLSRAKIQSLLH
ncbi:hypothetical protein AGMMS50289_14570 [Betaproteobacteria bacterium]|nr:hypothetical protein AGMMS50289_14570 [Betaproteobacteria bacterium]